MLHPHTDGVLVDVWVVPGASRDEVAGVHDGALRVRVSAPAEGGRANRAVGRVVAAHLGGRRGAVVEGLTSRRKQVLVRGVAIAAARRSLPAG
jgi:uncharacterized protein (TIGR00251 family)